MTDCRQVFTKWEPGDELHRQARQKVEDRRPGLYYEGKKMKHYLRPYRSIRQNIFVFLVRIRFVLLFRKSEMAECYRHRCEAYYTML